MKIQPFKLRCFAKEAEIIPTEALLGRFVRFGDPLECSAQNLADSLNAIVPIMRQGFDVFDRVLRVGVMNVVFGFLRCVHPAHHERKKAP